MDRVGGPPVSPQPQADQAVLDRRQPALAKGWLPAADRSMLASRRYPNRRGPPSSGPVHVPTVSGLQWAMAVNVAAS
jgi:hypothetical protein